MVGLTSQSSIAPLQNQVESSLGRNIAISSDQWLTHLLVLAKCNSFNGNNLILCQGTPFWVFSLPHLKKKNLILWERAIQAALKPRKLIHHLSEDCSSEDNPNFPRWVMEEEFVFAWLVDSIAPEQIGKFMSYDTSRGLWEAIRRSHSKLGDKAKVIDLISRSYSLKQGDKDILTYSNELRTIHTELDYFWPQSTDPVAQAREATCRLCQLLLGLRPEFEVVRSQI